MRAIFEFAFGSMRTCEAEGEEMFRKAILVFDSLIDKVLLAFSIVALLICVYAMYDAIKVYYDANDASVLKYKPHAGEGAQALKELSEDAIAWLTIDDTNIDYPVMQGKDNIEYVNKDPYGDFSLSGSIFLDSRNSPRFEDAYSLLYGHHMEYGMMFGALDEYLEKDYLEAHRTGSLVTVAGDSYDVWVFASMKAEANEDAVFDPTASGGVVLMNYVRDHAAVADMSGVSKDANILGLSTCTTAESLERTVVFATISKT